MISFISEMDFMYFYWSFKFLNLNIAKPISSLIVSLLLF